MSSLFIDKKNDKESQRSKKRSGPVLVNGIKLVKNSHNVYSKRYKAVSFKTPGKGRKPKSMLLSHSQLFSVCSMLICNDEERENFMKVSSESYRNKDGSIPSVRPSACINDGGMDYGEEKISKTPLWFINHCFQKSNLCVNNSSQGFSPMVLPSDITELGKAFSDAYLVQGLINTHSCVKLGLYNQHNNIVQHVRGEHNRNTGIPDVILYVPSAGVFYSRYAPAVTVSPKPSSSTYHPIDASWLRIRRDNGQAAKGGFLSKIVRLHRIIMANPPSAVFDCHHVPDTAIPLPPDVVKRDKVDKMLAHSKIANVNYSQRQKTYAAALLLSNTNRALSKRTAVGYLYKNPKFAPGNTPLIIDPTDGEICLRVLTKLSDMNNINSQHTVRIKFIEPEGEHRSLFSAASNLISHVPIGSNAGSIRATEREFSHGNMVAYGEHVFNSNKICEYGTTQRNSKYLSPFMLEYRKVLSHEFPLETSTVLAFLRSFGEVPPESMGGIGGVTKSVNISIDLGNAAHFDTNDLGTGIAFWVMADPNGSAENWTYIMPNLVGRRADGSTFQGVVVELRHGTLISWNGTDIRHCTGVPHSVSKGNHLYGMHITNNHNSLSLYPSVRTKDE